MAPNNVLVIHGNEKTMNMNHLILTNIQSSPYFKVNLYELKTYHEVIDEIYYKVSHLEPWERGSRKTAGQTGMCGGVRGVGAGGIVSSAFCLLYKLFTLRLTRKQVNGLITHADSPFIRGLGFMYIRYTQPPADLWTWYEEYLEDEEEIDVKAGGGQTMAVGEMLRQWLVKLEWFSTLFPRIPVPVQKMIEQKLREFNAAHGLTGATGPLQQGREERRGKDDEEPYFGQAARLSQLRAETSPVRKSPADRRPTPPFDIAKVFTEDKSRSHKQSPSRSKDRHQQPKSKDRHRRSRSKDRHRRSRSRDRERKREKRSRSRDRKHKRSRSRDKRSRSREAHRHKHKRRSHSREKYSSHTNARENSFERDLRKEKERQKRRKEESDY